MSVVLTQLFDHKDERNTEYRLKSYALDDKFYLHMKQHLECGWGHEMRMDFSVAEAKALKKQLEEFISQNT
jgi:hypothetical protein